MGWGWTTSSTWGLLFIRELTERCKKKRTRERTDSAHLTLCFCVFVCLYSLERGLFMQVCVRVSARQNIISCFFSSPLDFPALGRKLYFRKHGVWKYPSCLGKIYHACLFFVQEWIWQSHNWGSSIFLSVFVRQVYAAVHTSVMAPGESKIYRSYARKWPLKAEACNSGELLGLIY